MANNTKKLFIGLMSGTSMDGIDAALVDIENNKLIYATTTAYKPEIKAHLIEVQNKPLVSLKELSQLNTLLGREFARATNELLQKAQVDRREIQAIGSHGQTVCHDASAEIPYTLQLGCAHTIAELTEITVVADFRTRDLVNEGKGAPFAPIYHQILASGKEFPLGLVNIGGIANLSYLKNEDEVIGFDVGPGNCLMDAWIHQNQGLDFDKNGSWAASGKAIPSLLNNFLEDSFFKTPAPKSIGKEYFSLSWLKEKIKPHYLVEDIQATLLQLTARAIADSLKPYEIPKKLYICGGGVHNKALMKCLNELLPELNIENSQSLGMNPDYIEAAMFAWFAEKAINKIALDLSAITGVNKKAIYGVVYPKYF